MLFVPLCPPCTVSGPCKHRRNSPAFILPPKPRINVVFLSPQSGLRLYSLRTMRYLQVNHTYIHVSFHTPIVQASDLWSCNANSRSGTLKLCGRQSCAMLRHLLADIEMPTQRAVLTVLYTVRSAECRMMWTYTVTVSIDEPLIHCIDIAGNRPPGYRLVGRV